MEGRKRIQSLATITMFVALSLSRCWQAQSWLLRPLKHRALNVVTSHRQLCPNSIVENARRRPRWSTGRMASSVAATESDTATTSVSQDDRDFLAQALEHAKLGQGHTFPNPAVGCLIVRQDTQEVLGQGFHPKAGFPHAEIFALLEASGNVECGISSAKSIIDKNQQPIDGKLQQLVDDYTSGEPGSNEGAERLFGEALAEIPVTAYVTLEPCCHYGKTPPCAVSLSLAGVDRVVVGVRDPNPRVDGGGLKVLEEAGIAVANADDAGCANIVDSFVKRILPKDYDSQGYSHVSGVMRRGLRKLAGQRKTENALPQVSWSAKAKATTEDAVDELEFPPEWMEHLDALLWREELVNIRLNKAVKKKKLAKQLGNRLASELGAHVAQVVGHTVLLYRPAMPEPILDLEDLVGDLSDEDK